jgi:prephenate dehydrogenase
MTVTITIVGLGQIGASIGLALGSHKELVQRLGYDSDIRIARQAEKKGAVDRVEINLLDAARKAEIVILSVPLDQLRETMSLIAADLKESAVVMDTGPIKEVVAAWANELLPEGRYYVGLTPVINPAYLHDTDLGLDAARDDLFQGGLIAIVAPPRASSDAIKLAADLTRLLGAEALFADPLEIDGLMAATHILPQLMAAGLLNATIDQPGWREARKVAGRAYAEASAPAVHLGDEDALLAAALLNQENVQRVLDSAIAALQALRGDIARQDKDALHARLERARSGRELWWKERQLGDWSNEGIPPANVPDKKNILDRWFGLGRKTIT